jgi:hypothetical protein
VRGWEVRTTNLEMLRCSGLALGVEVSASVWSDRRRVGRGIRDGPAIGDALMEAVKALQTGARAERADMAYDMGVAEDKVDEPTFALDS